MQAELLKIPDYDEKILDIGQLNIVIVLSEKIGNISKKAEIDCVGSISVGELLKIHQSAYSRQWIQEDVTSRNE